VLTNAIKLNPFFFKGSSKKELESINLFCTVLGHLIACCQVLFIMISWWEDVKLIGDLGKTRPGFECFMLVAA
jgi:hypothetical protein